MTPELVTLTLAALLQVAQFALMAVRTNLEVGTGKTLSPRDPARLKTPLDQQVSAGTGRLIRAYSNHFESLILFAIATLVITVTDQSTAVTATAGWVYLTARVLYIPAYFFGWTPWRSYIWFIGLASIITLLIAALI